MFSRAARQRGRIRGRPLRSQQEAQFRIRQGEVSPQIDHVQLHFMGADKALEQYEPAAFAKLYEQQATESTDDVKVKDKNAEGEEKKDKDGEDVVEGEVVDEKKKDDKKD